MNLTFGFIAFFISIIIPGILFRRFYYYGEFSKQFATKDPVLHSIFLSLIPGVCIQLIGFYFLSQLPYFYIENFVIFNVFRDFVYLNDREIGADTQYFLDYGLGKFIQYSLIIFAASAVFGTLISRVIRILHLDWYSKLFRFRNQWYYVISGEVLNFKKFKSAGNLNYSKLPEDQKVLLTFADIMVRNQEGNRELYTGYVVDYDLNHENITKLDKIYLMDAYRYKKLDNQNSFNYGESQNLSLTDATVAIEQSGEGPTTASRTRVKIPGDLFIVSGENIVNINLTYIPSLEKQKLLKEEEHKKLKLWVLFLLIVTFSFIGIHVISQYMDFSNYSWLEEYFQKTSFWGKLYIIFYFNQFIGLFYPVKDSDGKYSYDKKSFFWKVVLFVCFSAGFYFLVKDQYICLNLF